MSTMFVKYRCTQCPVEGEVEVPKRHVATDLMFWMKIVAQKVADHHLAITGQNHGSCDLAIPMGENDDMIGRPDDSVIEKSRGKTFPVNDEPIFCDCELRNRQWNGFGRCLTCGRKYK